MQHPIQSDMYINILKYSIADVCQYWIINTKMMLHKSVWWPESSDSDANWVEVIFQRWSEWTLIKVYQLYYVLCVPATHTQKHLHRRKQEYRTHFHFELKAKQSNANKKELYLQIS